jgi:cytoskeleton protein RodZ
MAAAPSAATPASAPTAGAGAASGRVTIRAIADCWIQVRAPDSSIVFSRVLKSGEVYTVPARPGLSLRTGNAGALEIAVDGKTAPSIGGIGTLRRDVELDPTELEAGTAVHG